MAHPAEAGVHRNLPIFRRAMDARLRGHDELRSSPDSSALAQGRAILGA